MNNTKKKIQTTTTAILAILTNQAQAIAQTAPAPAPAAPPILIDFTAILPSVQTMILAVVGGITAIAAIAILPNVARWGFNQVIVWFGGEELEKEKEEEEESGRNMMFGA